jgi:hypothetical protein
MTLRNIFLERREKTRKVPHQFAFLQLEHDDGGKVLDISEGGLRFESFAPVRESNPIHFWFSLNLRERIEGWGELAWTDAGGKSGGLKFVRLSEGGHEQVREYLSGLAPRKVRPDTEAREADSVATFPSRSRPRESSIFSAKGGNAEGNVLFPTSPETAGAGYLVPLQRHLAALQRQWLIGMLIGACVGGIVTFAAFKFSQYLHKRDVPAKTAVELPAQTESPASSTSIAAPPVSASPKDVFAISNPKKEAAAARTPTPPPRESNAPINRQKTPLTPDQLWTLVQAGNSTAAAALAELYIKGDGVPQSCAQARVLLLVASEKRNAAAIKRLASLDKEGCPAN